MKYNPIVGCGNNPVTGLRYDRADYRGSIVDLTPGVTYEIELTLENTNTSTIIQATTWDENFPIAQTITLSDMSSTYYVPSSGSPAGYILIDGSNATIDVQDNYEHCIEMDSKSYVILRGFTLKNAIKHGIRIYSGHHIVIEDCDISGWGDLIL